MIDLIGDIHGHADKLEELLLKLDYAKSKGAYSHPDRKESQAQNMNQKRSE